jgi:hypothetical protein
MDENQPIRKKRSAVRYVLAEPTLFVTDAELIRRLGVPEKFAYAAMRLLVNESNLESLLQQLHI